ncbi:hypothetical protein FXO38_22960 [Capsicum annuum]|nr:hypothetical protein FXO38_22960 [Capsicum annuum]
MLLMRIGPQFSRDDHGQHDHESYYGDCDTDSLVKVRTRLVLDMEQKEARKEENLRIVKIEKENRVPGNLVILARSVAHIFDASQMNISHVISIFSFGMTLDTTSVTRINPDEITHFFEVHMNSMSGKEHKSSKETPFLMASVYGIELSVECNASTRNNPIGKISLIRVRRQKNGRYNAGDIDVLRPSILNTKRLGVDDVKGTGEELLYKLLWGEEGWNWWAGGA